MIQPGPLLVSALCLPLTVGMVVTSILVNLKRIRRHGPTRRHVVLLATTLLLSIDTLATTAAFLSIQYAGHVDLFLYYLARSVCFIPTCATYTFVVVSRISLMKLVAASRQRFVLCTTGMAALAVAVVIVGTWEATLKVVAIGTLDAWLWNWQLPQYSVVAVGVFPLVNVAACIWSMTAMTTSLVPAPRTGNQRQPLRSLTDLRSSSSLPNSCNEASRKPSSKVPLDTVSLPLAPHNSLGSLLKLASSNTRHRATVSVTETSLVQTFWLLSLCAIVLWCTFMALIGGGLTQFPILTRNIVYSSCGMAGVLVELAFEFVYRMQYARASHRRTAVKALDPGASVKTGVFGAMSDNSG